MAINFGALTRGYLERRDQIRKTDRDDELTRRKNTKEDLLRVYENPQTYPEVKRNIAAELFKLDQFPLEDASGFVKPYKYDPKILLPDHHKTPDELAKERQKAEKAAMPDPSKFTLGDILGPVLRAHAASGSDASGDSSGTLSMPMAGSQTGASIQTTAPMVQGPLEPPPGIPPQLPVAGAPAATSRDMMFKAGRDDQQPAGTSLPTPPAQPFSPSNAKPAGLEPPPGAPPDDNMSPFMSDEEYAQHQKQLQNIMQAVDIPAFPEGVKSWTEYAQSGPKGLTAPQLAFVQYMATHEEQQQERLHQRADSELNQVRQVNLLGFGDPKTAAAQLRATYPAASKLPGFDGFVTGIYAQQLEAKHDRDEERASRIAARNASEEQRQFLRQQRLQAKVDEDNIVKTISDGVKAGITPPVGAFSPRSRIGMAVVADLAKQGVDYTKQVLEWNAENRYLAAANSQPQVRLRQQIEFTMGTLDKIDTLAAQWDAGRFPLLNKGNLAAARNGAYGQQAQEIATKLEGIVNDFASELAGVYRSGNAATDDALQLAASNLHADWGKKTLQANIKQVRELLELRQRAIYTAGPVSLGNGPNMYGGGKGVVEEPPGSDKPPGVKNFTITEAH